MVRGGCVWSAVCVCLRSGAALVYIRLDVVPLPSSSSSQTVEGCLFSGHPVGRDQFGGNHIVGGVLPHIHIVSNVWGKSSIMTGVYQHWCLSTLYIRWGLCYCVCLVLVCRGRYSLGRVVLLFILGSNLGRVGPVGLFGGDEEGGGVRSGSGEARTILLFHIISARPSKQARMVRTFLQVHTRPRLLYPLQCRGY
jgi:hypothetical protein